MQLVRRNEGVERDVLDLMPIAHNREAAEQIDVFLLGRERNLIFHALRLGFGEHPRRKLHIDQHHVRADGLECLDAS